MKDDDIVVLGANLAAKLLLGILFILIVLGASMYCAVTGGCRLPDWQMPCPKEDAPEFVD
jgi:hypothetical protein